MNSRKLNKTKLISIIAAAILAAAFYVTLFTVLFPKIRKNPVVKGFSDYKTVTVEPGSVCEYPFEQLRSSFDHITFFVMDGDAKSLSVSVSREETDILKDVRITGDLCVPEGNSTSVILSGNGKPGFTPGNYKVRLINTSSSPVAIAVEKADDSLTVRLTIDTSAGQTALILTGVFLFVFLTAVICVYVINGFSPSVPTEKLFLAAAIPLCAAFILLLPPWSTGDSEAHYLACYRLSNIFLGQSGSTEWMGRADDVAFFRDIWWNATPPSLGGYEILKSNFRLFALDKSLIQMSATSEKMNYYSAFCYIPQTAALVLGRLIGFGPVADCYLAKIFTAAFYIVLCFRAIKKAPFGKSVFALCAILPSSLMMSSAFSYDPMVIITALNFISSVLLLRDKPDDKKSLAFVCIWSFILGAVKGGGYLILLPLLFIVPAVKKGIKLINKAIPVVCGLLSVAIFDMFLPSGSLFQFGSKGNGFMTASFALENPVAYLKMTVVSYAKFGADMLSDLFGSKLCWGENTIPFVFSILMFIVLLFVAATDPGTSRLKKNDVIILAAIVLIALLTTPAMLLSWTPEGSDVILGIQGHYFLPVLPLFSLITGKGIRFVLSKTGMDKRRTSGILKLAPYPAAVILMFFAFYYILKLYLSR